MRLAILPTTSASGTTSGAAPSTSTRCFELVVDSAFEGTRKPEPRIYEITLERLGLAAEDCAFIDDVEVNVTAARELGLHGIHFRDTDAGAWRSWTP